MTTQITVRIADDLVAFADAEVGAGRARSRASLVERALRRERRRACAERDAAIYAAMSPDDDELAGIAELGRRSDLSDLD
ncbi:hypothetical protein [Piscicoccus intestinalis]|uniref:hypothetical protein n=1 Tax=Piscicoccus intestinalis TaxID=746033 RepID=UPI000839AC25|nr:hypothetical protein [Piscicoccus intestinalis]